MNFSVGGTWLYAMISPEGQKHWSRADYQAIETLRSFAGLNAFCDGDGTIDETFPRTIWKVTFMDQGETSQVHVENTFEALEDLKKIIERGFKEGFSAGLENLDELLTR